MIYCIIVSDVSEEIIINPLQISQNKLVRAICGTIEWISPHPNLILKKIFIVKDMYNYMVCIYILKSISSGENVLEYRETQHNTRQALSQNLHVPHAYCTQTKHFLTYIGPRFFNTVLINIRRCKSFVTFKYRLEAHILYK